MTSSIGEDWNQSMVIEDAAQPSVWLSSSEVRDAN